MLSTRAQRATEAEARRLLKQPAVLQAKQQAMAYLSGTSFAVDPTNRAELPGLHR